MLTIILLTQSPSHFLSKSICSATHDSSPADTGGVVMAAVSLGGGRREGERRFHE
jgi:hypothetical protein